MQSILNKIYNHKVELVNHLESKESLKNLKKRVLDTSKSRGFINKLKFNIKKKKPSIIGEIKKASPSKGIIKKNFYPEELAKIYQSGDASCISVLTDSKFFLGSNNDLKKVRKVTNIPILRKDFIVSEYQIYESKVIGADCILLIAEILSKDEIDSFSDLAKSLDLDVIIEVHSELNFQKYINNKDVLLGINNRNLKNMTVDINHVNKVAKEHNKNNIICESGINSIALYKNLLDQGFKNFLIGEHFMKSKDIYKELKKFTNLTLKIEEK